MCGCMQVWVYVCVWGGGANKIKKRAASRLLRQVKLALSHRNDKALGGCPHWLSHSACSSSSLGSLSLSLSCSTYASASQLPLMFTHSMCIYICLRMTPWRPCFLPSCRTYGSPLAPPLLLFLISLCLSMFT